jgi:hypothetical protein
MSKERELLKKAKSAFLVNIQKWGYKDEQVMLDCLNEIEAFLGESVQEPEPVAWMWQSDNYATRFSQRIFELFDEADDMRNRYGGNLYPLYFEASPNAKRIAELEYHLEHEKLCINDYVYIVDELKGKIEYLESRINNGVRVYAERGFANNWEAYGRWHKPANATLILDEQGEG